MSLATESAIRSSAAGATLLNLSGAAAGVSGSLLAAAEVITAPVAATSGAILGGAFIMHLAVNGAVAGIFPRKFTKLSVDLSRTRFNQDYEAPTSYSNMAATAVSTGWISDSAISEFLASAAGLGQSRPPRPRRNQGISFQRPDGDKHCHHQLNF